MPTLNGFVFDSEDTLAQHPSAPHLYLSGSGRVFDVSKSRIRILEKKWTDLDPACLPQEGWLRTTMERLRYLNDELNLVLWQANGL